MKESIHVGSIFFVFCLLFGCSTNYDPQRTSEHANSSEQKTAITKDAEGNEINPEGWAFPLLKSDKKTMFTLDEKYEDGSPAKVKVTTSWVSEQRVLFFPTTPESKHDSVISNISELRVGNGKVYCYEFGIVPHIKNGGNAIAVTVKCSFCDLDGDGKFERRGDRLRNPPDWTR